MGLSKDYFTRMQDLFHNSTLQVENVKLGDVMYVIESRKQSMLDLIDRCEEDLVQFKNNENEHMVEYMQKCIEKYQFAIEQFDSIYGCIKLYK